jgi:anaphase-promoting complex subunit 1
MSAGFLFGMGLNGHLKKIESTDSLRYYLLPQFEMVSVGLLLGLGVSFIGTRSSRIIQMISVHIVSEANFSHPCFLQIQHR